MTEITAESTIWFPGFYRRREGVYAQRISMISRKKLVELVQQRAQEDGEWAIENGHVGDRPEFMRKLIAWVSDEKNIIQCIEANSDMDSTVDWICYELANGSKWVGSRG